MNWQNQSKQESFFLLQMEKRIPKDDILRIIDDKLDFSFIDDIVRPLYSNLGPIGYSPQRLFKMLVVMYLENIPSERKLVEQINVNIRYLWFTKTDIENPVPDHSTFSVFRNRLGDKLFKEIFEKILSNIINLGIAHPESISVDSTSVLADVKVPKDDRHDTKQVISPTDPDARYGRTSSKDKFFGYKANVMIDNDTSCVLNIDAEPGNFQDYEIKESFIKAPLKNNNLKPKEATLDKGYDSYRIRHFFKEQSIETAIPVRATKYENGKFYNKNDFQIDLKHKLVTCPANKKLKYSHYDNKEQTHIFIGTNCNSCILKDKCTTGKFRTLKVHQDYLLREEAIKFSRTEQFKQILKKRTCVERLIAEAKRYHGMIRSKFRCIWKLKIQLFLIATVINMKRIAKFFITQADNHPVIDRAGP